MKTRKPIDAALSDYLRNLPAPAGASMEMTDGERAAKSRILMMSARENRVFISGLPNDVASREVAIIGAVTGRMYWPTKILRPMPTLIYFHGGGWVAGSIDTHDPFCRLLCAAAEIAILSVNYRLAPENPFPAAVKDALSALDWAIEHAEALGLDTGRIALGGDSAGANVAAVAANRFCAGARAHGLRAQLLLYPVTDHPSGAHKSYEENALGYGLDAGLMHWFWRQYASAVSPNDPDVSPLRQKSFPALPPTFVATAEYDPLRDEGIAYVDKLRASGVAVRHVHASDMHHNFPVHPGTVARFPQCDHAMREIAGWLRRILGGINGSESKPETETEL